MAFADKGRSIRHLDESLVVLPARVGREVGRAHDIRNYDSHDIVQVKIIP